MADYRRCYVPGGSFFFTVVTERRAAILGDDLSRDLLRTAFRACRRRWPFRVDALVMLRDHLHAIWTSPPGDTDRSKRWGAIKKPFTQSWLALGGSEQPRTASRSRYRRRGIWQRRFWAKLKKHQSGYRRTSTAGLECISTTRLATWTLLVGALLWGAAATISAAKA